MCEYSHVICEFCEEIVALPLTETIDIYSGEFRVCIECVNALLDPASHKEAINV